MSAPFHEEEALGKSYDARLVRRLLAYLRPYRRRVALSFGLMVLSAALQLAAPTLTKLAIDRAIPARDAGLARQLAILLLVALVLEFLAEYAQTLLTARIGQDAMLDLRMAI